LIEDDNTILIYRTKLQDVSSFNKQNTEIYYCDATCVTIVDAFVPEL